VPRKKSPTLTEAEQRLMEVLWERGESTVAEVVEGVAVRPTPAYSTVLTTLRILERKKYVEHTKEGRAFRYRPVVDRRTARQSAVRHLLGRFFDGSPSQLVLNLIEQEEIGARELKRLRKLIGEGRR
jgi:predicted transcriptional regulator